MSQDIAAHWFLRVNRICHAASRVSSHLICQKYCHIELFTNFLQSAQHFAQTLLPLRQLSSTRVVNPKRSHYRINYHQREAILNHDTSALHQQIGQSVDCECTPNHDVGEDLFWVQVEPLRYRFDSFGPERVLSVDEQNFSLTTAL